MPKWDKEKIAVLETNQLNMADSLKKIENKVTSIEINAETNFREILTKIDWLENKFANKWTEVAMKRAMGIIMWIVISAMVYQVIAK